jgi:hypothetical protein
MEVGSFLITVTAVDKGRGDPFRTTEAEAHRRLLPHQYQTNQYMENLETYT